MLNPDSIQRNPFVQTHHFIDEEIVSEERKDIAVVTDAGNGNVRIELAFISISGFI